jgi:peptide/nickel transport system ATP-binding protein
VRNVSFTVAPGEIVGIVGESGSGKTQAARAIMGLTPPPLVRSAGRILFEGEDMAAARRRAFARAARRAHRHGVPGAHDLAQPVDDHRQAARRRPGAAPARTFAGRAARQGLAMLARVGITDPQAALAAWPHEFSGGMRQRMMLASVMLLEPALLIADEPTTALDAWCSATCSS